MLHPRYKYIVTLLKGILCDSNWYHYRYVSGTYRHFFQMADLFGKKVSSVHVLSDLFSITTPNCYSFIKS